MTRLPTLCAAALALLAPLAAADFTAVYDHAGWTFENTLGNDDGTLDATNASTLVLTGGDNGTDEEGFTRYTIPSQGSGLFSFTWDVVHPDPGFDLVGFFVGDEEFELTRFEGDGEESVLVCPGETLGFFIYSSDNNLGTPTLTVTGFSGPTTDPWLNLGGGIPGTLGLPVIKLTGSLEPEPVRLEIANCPPSSSVFLLLSIDQVSLRFKGGVIHPNPAPENITATPLDADGELSTIGLWPPGVPPGTQFWAQVWFTDPGALKGFAASDGIQATSP
jgi:hypothetical protein